MTREQALEAALRDIIEPDNAREIRFDSKREYYVADIEGGELARARAALALPPDGINADMLAALREAKTTLTFIATAAHRRACGFKVVHEGGAPVTWADWSEMAGEADQKIESAIARATREG